MFRVSGEFRVSNYRGIRALGLSGLGCPRPCNTLVFDFICSEFKRVYGASDTRVLEPQPETLNPVWTTEGGRLGDLGL